MSDLETNKQIVHDFIETVWNLGIIDQLPTFWTDDCINHAMPGENRGLAVLRAYHESFVAAFSAFSDLHIEIVQQIAEDDRVMTYLIAHGKHTGIFNGIAATGKPVSLATMRIDRLNNGKIAEHWSVADMAGLMQQLHT